MSARPENGFTLLELLVVIAIIASLSAAFPLALNRFVPARRVDSAARVLLSDIRLAQARSVTIGRPVQVEVSAHGYRVDPAVSRELRRSTSLELRSIDDAQPLNLLKVFPDGSTSGGRFVLRDGVRVRTVSVSTLTGRARLESAP